MKNKGVEKASKETKDKGSKGSTKRVVVVVVERVEEFVGRGHFVGSLHWELSKVGNPKPILQINCEPK